MTQRNLNQSRVKTWRGANPASPTNAGNGNTQSGDILAMYDHKSYQSDWKSQNSEEIREYNRLYYQANKEKLNERQRQRRFTRQIDAAISEARAIERANGMRVYNYFCYHLQPSTGAGL